MGIGADPMERVGCLIQTATTTNRGPDIAPTDAATGLFDQQWRFHSSVLPKTKDGEVSLTPPSNESYFKSSSLLSSLLSSSSLSRKYHQVWGHVLILTAGLVPNMMVSTEQPRMGKELSGYTLLLQYTYMYI